MRDNYLLHLATEMLETTNPYHKPLHTFYYFFMELDERIEVSLLGKLENRLKGKHKSFRQQDPLARDYAICYEAIAYAMVDYFDNYNPQSYAFLQETKRKFSKWLKAIEETYSISEQIEPEELQSSPQDTVVALLKALHPRKRVTVHEIAEQMEISDRAVQKNLKKLDPTWNPNSDGVSESTFRIGGMPVEVKVEAEQPETGKATLYRTLNTVHPLVLLENQMQVGILLKSLSHSYYAEESGVCYSIGLDIWYQLSDYSRERVRIYFASDDEELKAFIEELECAIPDSSRIGFQTERSMLDYLGGESLSKEELLTYAAKGHGRRCTIVLRNRGGDLTEYVGYILNYKADSNGARIYIASGPNGEKVEFEKNDLEDIEI